MNAKSGRVSLPDRVEAAAKARHEAQFPETPWRVMSEPTKSHDRELMKVALAAADACEAERNPNTTDALVREAIMLAHHPQWPNAPTYMGQLREQCARCDSAAAAVVAALQAVSSEDVHRMPHAVDLGSIKHVIDFSDDQSGRACDITNAEVAALLALCEEQAQELARRDEYEAVEGWRIGHRRASNPHPALDICDTDEPPCGPVFRRRPVSSEDVHREADDGN